MISHIAPNRPAVTTISSTLVHHIAGIHRGLLVSWLDRIYKATYRDLRVRQLAGLVFSGVLNVREPHRRDTHHSNALAVSVTPSSGWRCFGRRRGACGNELGSDLL